MVAMKSRRPTSVLALAAALAATALAAPAMAGASMGTGTGSHAEQVAWVRRAASRFVGAELAGSGASACGVLYAPLRASSDGRSCEQRWDARLARMLRVRRQRTLLHTELRQIARAPVQVHGDVATLALAQPLLGAASRLIFSENCWMLSD